MLGGSTSYRDLLIFLSIVSGESSTGGGLKCCSSDGLSCSGAARAGDATVRAGEATVRAGDGGSTACGGEIACEGEIVGSLSVLFQLFVSLLSAEISLWFITDTLCIVA